MKDPDNLRNRWRRYRVACAQYRHAALPFRLWANGARPDSYRGGGFKNEEVPLIACRCLPRTVCTCITTY